ncbi:MAG: DUF6128 domain-containing protein [Hungatella sp.]
MSNYRRLISYMYAYEGGVKGKNMGFAKLEAKNGQCKISVNVKKVYVGNSDMGVYLLGEDKEIFLGKVFIRNGAGEYRGSVSVTDVENSGQTMDQCYGLTIHSVEDSWQSYTTIWEDALVRAAAVDLGEVTSEHTGEMENAHTQTCIPEKNSEEMARQHKSSIIEEIEAEIQAQEADQASQQAAQESPQAMQQPQESSQATQQPQQPAHPAQEPQQPAQPAQEPQQPAQAAQESQQPEPMRVGDPQILEQLEKEEEESCQPGQIWNYFRKNYAKIQAFDYTGGCEILTIKPQDLGLLPRETWIYGNNSFLLHGYYNYRYLILVKLWDPQGDGRYLLGVPGHYYSNEKYMASMFGFPNFVLSKTQPTGDGRFGYWYTDINLGH